MSRRVKGTLHALAFVAVAVGAALAGHHFAPAPCSSARHVVECADCQAVGKQLAITAYNEALANARKAQAPAPKPAGPVRPAELPEEEASHAE